MKQKKTKRTNVSSSVANKSMRANIKQWFPLFMLPMILAFIVGFVAPFVMGIGLSFCRFNVVKDAHFNGFYNYQQVFTDSHFLHAFWYTALFAVVSTILINVLAFALAYALTSGLKGTNFFRTIFFMPNLIGGIVLGVIWKSLLDQIIQAIWGTTFLTAPNGVLGFWGLIILLCWQQIGYMMIIYVAALQNVPTDFIEAARMDGANGWQILRKIIIPSIMPSVTICTFLSLTNGFKLYDQNFSLTNGYPYSIEGLGHTEMLALNIANTYMKTANNQGIGQAKAVVFFVLVVIIALGQLYFTKRKEVQQ